MKLINLIVVLVYFVGFFSCVCSDSAGSYRRHNGLAYGGIPYGSITGRIADYIRSQARFPIRSFSTEDYSDEPEDDKIKNKITETNELDSDPRLTVAKFVQLKRYQ